MPRYADNGAGFALPANVFVEAESEGAAEAAVLEKETTEDFLADSRCEVGFVVPAVFGEAVLRTADGVDAAEGVLGIGTPGARLPDVAGIEVSVQRKSLTAEAARNVEQEVLVMVIAVCYRAIGIDARRRGEQT